MSVTRQSLSALARVRAAAHSLGPSEGRVAAVIIANPDDVVGWSTAELAQAADTSTATVIRACQSLGFRGFQHLRLEVARAAPLAPQERDNSADTSFDAAVDAIRLAQESVDPRQIERAAQALRQADRIVLVGSGFSGPPLQDFAMRLSTLGSSVEAPIDPLGQQFAVRSLAPGDVCLALSYSGANSQTLRACAAAAERGVTIVLITSYARSPIGRRADIIVTTGATATPHEVDPFFARLSHLVVLQSLYAGLAQAATQRDVEGMRAVVADALIDD